MSDDLTEDEMEALSQAMGDEEPKAEDARDEASGTEKPAAAPASSAAPAQPEGSTATAVASEAATTPESAQIAKAQFMQLEDLANAAELPPQDLERMADISVHVEVVLGSTRKTLEEILKLQSGSVVELERLAGEPLEITANGQLIARAEVVVIDGNFGVKIVEIAGTKRKLSVIAG